MPYYLAPYIGQGTRVDGFRPRGSDQPGWSAIDLRPDGSQLVGWCLLHLPIHDPDPILDRLVDAPDEPLTPGRRNRLQTLLGITLGQTQFNRIVEELLTLHARTDGTRWKPLRPTVDGRMEIYLGGLLSRWQQGSVGAAISENWNCADSASLTCQLTWTEIIGTAWEIFSNQARVSAANSTDTARAESDLATADHFAEVTEVQHDVPAAGLEHDLAPMVRKDGTNFLTYYVFYQRRLSTGDDVQLWKRVVSVYTQLGATLANTFAANQVIRTEANGSTIRGLIAGIELISATDTEITGNLRVGMERFSNDTTTRVVIVDNLSAADLAAATQASPALVGSLAGWW